MSANSATYKVVPQIGGRATNRFAVVFESVVIQTFVERFVRLCILEQFVEENRLTEDFPVLVDERKLMANSIYEMRLHLFKTNHVWNSDVELAKMSVRNHLIEMIKDHVQTHDFDEENADLPEMIVDMLEEDDFDRVWPAGWL